MVIWRWVLLGVAALAGVSAQAQMSRWQLGNPSLILDLPGDPQGGGVSWHDAASILPTSWSAESADIRVEVVEQYTPITPTDLAKKLGGTASEVKNYGFSGYAGNRFDVGPKKCVLIQAPGRMWGIVATPKTGAGANLAEKVFLSIVVERSGEQRWVLRSMGQTAMNAELPFDLAPEPKESATRAGYELHFDDFGVTASAASADEGSKIDFDKTIKTYIEDEKNRPGTKEFKVKREKLKRDQLDAEIVTLELERGKQYKLVSFFVNEKGQLLRLNLTARQGNAAHDDYIDRIANSLRVSSVNFAGFEPRQVGSEGIWFDLPKPLEKIDESNYNAFAGSFQINVRVTPVTPGSGSNPDQLLDFLEVKFKNAKDARDFKAERSRMNVNGVEARILKTGYKGKGRADQTMQYGMALFLPDRIIVAEMISEEQQKAYLERIVDTARIEIAAPSGWLRQRAGDSGLSVLATKFTVERPGGSDDTIESQVNIDINADGFMATVTELKYKGEPRDPAVAASHMFGSVKTAMKSEGEIISQQPIQIGNHRGVKLEIEYTRTEGKAVGDIIVLTSGKYLWTLFTVANPQKAEAMKARATLMNSIQ